MKNLHGKRLYSAISTVFLIVHAVVVLIPILWAVSTAFKPQSLAFANPPVWIPIPATLDNFTRLYSSFPYFSFMRNTIFITLVVLVFQLILGSFAAYAFGRMSFPGKNALFLILLSSLMIPQSIIMVPQYLFVSRLGWLDTYQGVTVPLIFMNVFSIFLLRQYFLGLPKDFEEAATIDGAGILRTFLSVMLPMVRPAMVTVAVLSFMRTWNNFLWPLITTNSMEKMVLSVGLSLLVGQYDSDWAAIMAAAVTALVPLLVLFIVAQRYFVESIYMTGVK